MATFETTMAQQRKRQRTSQQQLRRATRGTVVTVVAVAIFMIASLSRSAFFLVTTVTSLSTGHPLHRRKATTTKLNAEENENETASSIVGNWIQTAIETTVVLKARIIRITRITSY